MIGQNLITWNSTPDTDEWFYDSFWSCADWITWFKALKGHYPKQEAMLRWVTAWNDTDVLGHETLCLAKSSFANYFKKEGIEIDNTFTALIVGVQDITGNVIEGSVSISKFLKNIAPLLAIGVGLYFAAPYLMKQFILYKKMK